MALYKYLEQQLYLAETAPPQSRSTQHSSKGQQLTGSRDDNRYLTDNNATHSDRQKGDHVDT